MALSQHRHHANARYSQVVLNYPTYSRDMRYHHQERTTTSWTEALRNWVILIAVLIFGIHMAWSKHVSAQQAAAAKVAAQAQAVANKKDQNFQSQVNQLIAANPSDTISVSIATADRQTETIGSTGTFDGASTGKLLTASDYLTHVQQGEAKLGQKIDGQSAKNLLEPMVVLSDNDAWADLNGYLTHQDLASYAQSIDFTNYDPDTNTFTSADMANLLKKLYQGDLLNDNNRDLLLSYMKRANYRQYIPAAIPSEGYTVYHKVGFDNDTINDTAIIVHGGKFLVLTIYTDGNGNYDAANRTDIMHQITKDALAAYL